jgi:hypothetical protein
MLTRKRLIVAAALLAIASSLTPAQAQTVSRGGSVQAQTVRPGGRVIDSQGRRYWNGRWDNTWRHSERKLEQRLLPLARLPRLFVRVRRPLGRRGIIGKTQRGARRVAQTMMIESRSRHAYVNVVQRLDTGLEIDGRLVMAGTLSEKLIPRLLARFPGRGVRLHQGKCPVASFPAVHPEVGDLQIHDDDEELTILVGLLTHGHFSPSNYQEPSEKRDEEVIDRVMEFLDAVFKDQIEFWSAGKVGGWRPRQEESLVRRPDLRRYVWSGPVP